VTDQSISGGAMLLLLLCLALSVSRAVSLARDLTCRGGGTEGKGGGAWGQSEGGGRGHVADER
jgi:hypothetical protein